MGFVANVITQGVITFVVLGSLKRAGVIKVESRAIEQPALRSVFESGMSFGDAVAEWGDKVVKEFKKA